ncbi:DUF2165 domain-containing protein [Utexia brackfieldae]|uniref:DUF2165 family protein n=1 Tax=Utexia brackfieldae TaxID=3074108 RepID=UPI00370DC4AB
MKSKFDVIATQQLLKATVALMVGFFCLIVGYDNIIDFQTNYGFVNSVLSMNTMEPFFSGSTAITSRAIESPTLHLAGYWLIIIGELVAGTVCMIGSLTMFASIKKARFVNGQVIYLAGAVIAVLIWYFGFAVIGGEYFSMWANKMNGQAKAYTFATFILLTAIFVAMPLLKRDDK